MGVGEGGGVVSAPPHATRSRVDSRAPPHAVRAIARGAWAPARRVDAPLRCGVPQGPHRLVRWCGGVVRRGVSVGAEQARARTPFASPAGDSAIRRPRRSGCARLCSCPAMLIPPSPPPLALPSWDRKALLGSERSGAKFIGILLLVSNNNLATEIHLLQELVEHFGQGLGAQVIFTEEILKNIIN